MKPRTVRVLAWGSLGLSVAFGMAAVMISARNADVVSGQEALQAGTGGTAVFATLILTFSIVGAIIASRRPENGLGWLFCFDGLLLSFQNLASGYGYHGLTSNPGSVPGAVWLDLADDSPWPPFIFLTTVFLFLLFPEGQLSSPGRRRAAAIAAVAVVVATIVGGALEPNLYSYPDIANPFGIRLPDALYGIVTGGSFLVLLGVL